MCDSDADVLILAGDIAVGEAKHFRKALGLFDRSSSLKLFVPGNHDLWSLSRRPDTERRYTRALRNTAAESGFHYLPHAPLCCGPVGFVGAVGWYDYQFRQTEAPQPQLRVTPLRAVRSRSGTMLTPIGATDLAWGDVTDVHYAGKALRWSSGEGPVIWNDALHIDWQQDDRAVVERLTGELASDAAAIDGDADHWVAVTHMVPFRQLIGSATQDVVDAFTRAYAGSPRLGEHLLGQSKCRLALCGHVHRQRAVRLGPLLAVNCSVGDGASDPVTVTYSHDTGSWHLGSGPS